MIYRGFTSGDVLTTDDFEERVSLYDLDVSTVRIKQYDNFWQHNEIYNYHELSWELAEIYTDIFRQEFPIKQKGNKNE
jgi:hypothetical protein